MVDPGSPNTANTANSLRIVVADGDPLARQALRATLGRHPDLEVEAEARSGREAVEVALRLEPDVVLLDADIPDGDGIVATTLIARRSPDVRVLVLSRIEDDALGLLVLRAGASGFLRKDVAPDALARAVRGLNAGEAAISRTLARKVVDRLRTAPERGSGMRPVHSTLTTREWQVLDLLCDGASTTEIAETLVLTPDTVRTHVKHVLSKLGAHTRDEAIAAATRLRTGLERTPPTTLDELTQRRIAARDAPHRRS